jgi:hypothetical protein
VTTSKTARSLVGRFTVCHVEKCNYKHNKMSSR